jgi:hypothetical protein
MLRGGRVGHPHAASHADVRGITLPTQGADHGDEEPLSSALAQVGLHFTLAAGATGAWTKYTRRGEMTCATAANAATLAVRRIECSRYDPDDFKGALQTMATTKKPAAKKPAAKPISVKPITEVLSKSGLITRLSEHSGVDAKGVRAVLAALEQTFASAIHKKGIGQFTLSGLLKVTSQAVAAKPKRRGVDPFTKEERWFAAKPASVRVKIRALKKLKDAAL